MERTRTGGFRFPPEQTAAGGRCSVYIVDHTGTMQFAEVRLPAPPPPALPLSEAKPKHRAFCLLRGSTAKSFLG